MILKKFQDIFSEVRILRMMIKNINKKESNPGTNTSGSVKFPPVLFITARDTPNPTGSDKNRDQKISDGFVFLKKFIINL
tara:strand:- start:246 stop:485 length:240 start_codon:yes stop_codon:yes gene_type:complete